MLKMAYVQEVLSKLGPTLRKMASERDGLLAENARLLAKVAHYEREERISKIAHTLEGRGPFQNVPMEERRAFVEKRAMQDGASLDVLEEAARMMAKDGSFCSVSEKTAGALDARVRFEALIMEHS